jgi:hypothetical protein
VALSSAAVALLKAMPRLPIRRWFPRHQGQALSDMSLSAVLKRMDLGHFTVHGFRSTFRDWAAEQGFAFDAIKRHWPKIGNSVVTASAHRSSRDAQGHHAGRLITLPATPPKRAQTVHFAAIMAQPGCGGGIFVGDLKRSSRQRSDRCRVGTVHLQLDGHTHAS